MKIAIIGFSGFPVLPNASNYLQEYAYHLIKGLVNLGYDVTYFGLYGSKLPCEVYPLNLNSIDWSHDENISAGFKQFGEEQHGYFEIFKYLQETDFHLVHNISQNQIPVFTAQFLKIPTITTLFHRPQGLLQSSMKLNQTSNNYYIAINHAVANACTGHSKIDDIIYCGINFNSWSFNPNPETNTVFFAGDILVENHIDKVIDAAEDGNFQLTIYGEEVNKDYYKKMIAPRLNEKNKIHHSLKKKNYKQDLQKATVAVFTKRTFISSSYLALEALSCGTPVVVISDNMNTDYIPDTCGVQINTSDPQELRKAFVNAASKSRKDCRDYVMERFDYNKMIENYIEFYNRILY